MLRGYTKDQEGMFCQRLSCDPRVLEEPELARHLSAAKTTRPSSTAIRLLQELWRQCGNINDRNKRRDDGCICTLHAFNILFQVEET